MSKRGTTKSRKTTSGSKKKSIGISAGDVSDLTSREHALQKPSMYFGRSIRASNQEVKQLKGLSSSLTAEYFSDNLILVSDGEARLFLEIASNATDALLKTKRKIRSQGKERLFKKGIKLRPIEITVDKEKVTVRNYGVPILIEKKISKQDKKEYWLPELIFGVMRSSTNYADEDACDKSRYGCGTNGVGAKLTNIYSKKFIYTGVDSINKKKYVQTWTNNMKDVTTPTITASKEDSYVEITYYPDLKRFNGDYELNGKKVPIVRKEITSDIIEYFAAYAYDMAFANDIKVIFNGKLLDGTNTMQYSQMYLTQYQEADGESIKIPNHLYFFDWPITAKIRKSGMIQSSTNNSVANIKAIIIDTPGQGSFTAFSNGMPNGKGGVHVDKIYQTFGRKIVDKINSKIPEKSKIKPLTIKAIKKHMTVIVAVQVLNPEFNNQSKEKLTHPDIKIKQDNYLKKLVRMVEDWDLVEALANQIMPKQKVNRKTTKLNVEKYMKANKAGTSKSKDCYLYISEGDSAKTFVATARQFVEGGNDLIGAFPLKGKPINAIKASRFKLAENIEFTTLQKILGLNPGTVYTEKNIKDLRYGHLVIAADADVDGKHIAGLILAFFKNQYPSLLKLGFVKLLRAPIIQAKRGKEKLYFFTDGEYQKWYKKNKNGKWKIEYFKGLGSVDEDIIKESFMKEIKVVDMKYDVKSDELFKLGFDPKGAKKRREWLLDYNVKEVTDVNPIMISRFLDIDLKEYSYANMFRAIPSAIDGLKDSSRKIIYTTLNQMNIYTKPLKFKLSSYVGKVMDFAIYDHGPTSLEGTIIKMGQDHVGANNLPLLEVVGNYGTRSANGNDAAAGRYLHLTAPDYLKYIFRREDQPILVPREQDGELVEPLTYYPIVPIHLINGVEGIATGFRTFLPNFAVMDCVRWIRNHIKILRTGKGKDRKIRPSYMGFRGTITITKKRPKDKVAVIEDDEEDETVDKSKMDQLLGQIEKEETGKETDKTEKIVEDELAEKVLVDKNTRRFMYVEGDISKVDAFNYLVEEIPIRVSTDRYESHLKKLVEEQGWSYYFAKESLVNHPVFKVKAVEYNGEKIQKKDLHSIFKLAKTFGLNHINLLDKKDRLINFKTERDLLEFYFKARLSAYKRRKKHWIGAKQDNIEKTQMMARLAKLVYEKKEFFVNNKTTEESIEKLLKKNKINVELYQNVRLRQFNKDRYKELMEKVKKLKEDLKEYEETSVYDMWLAELDEFVASYQAWYKKWLKKDQINKQKKRKIK